MKRSEINRALKEAIDFFEGHQFYLPSWAHWSLSDWKSCSESYSEIVHVHLGWDVTDFGSNDLSACGLVLFTCRNGVPGEETKPYCEKAIVLRAGQESPYHFHWQKIEDIIDRGGGRLTVQLLPAGGSEEPLTGEVEVSIDGIKRLVRAGEPFMLSPGESIRLPPRLYHRLSATDAGSDVLVGEVSSINDDATDNRFLVPAPRFPAILEDEELAYLLVSDYESRLPAFRDG